MFKNNKKPKKKLNLNFKNESCVCLVNPETDLERPVGCPH